MAKFDALGWIFRRIRRRVPALILMTAAHMGSAALGVAFALGTRQVIDSATSGTGEELAAACLIQGGIILGILSCTLLYRWLHEWLLAKLDMDWKKDLLHGLLHGKYAQVKAFHSAELMNRLNNDVKTLDEAVLTVLPNSASMITRLVCAIGVLGALDPRLTLVVLAGGVVVIGLTAFLRHKLKGIHKQVSLEDGKVSGFMQETFEKLLMVQALDISTEIEVRTGILLDRRFQVERKRKNISLFANTSIHVMSYGAGFLALVWCASGLMRGTMSFGSLTAITQLVSQLQGPFVNLSQILPKYVAMVAAAERLKELEDLEQEPESAALDIPGVYRQMQSIGGEGLTFSYDRDQVLCDAKFLLPKGSFAVITGPSGIGKSTLLKLLLGVFAPEQGSLTLNCENGAIPLDRSTRRMFAYVPQGNLLLSGTLRENLTVVRPGATEEEIRQAVYVSAMDEFLPQLPNGLDTMLGESGAGLSEGQAQRLAIARAILSGAPILLLDEATSALDDETEQLVLSRIRALREYTCIAVTHRSAAVALCDWNLEIQEKQIIAKKVDIH